MMVTGSNLQKLEYILKLQLSKLTAATLSSCTHTSNGANQWWTLYLDQTWAIMISKVVIYNRQDCCSERINGAKVSDPFISILRTNNLHEGVMDGQTKQCLRGYWT